MLFTVRIFESEKELSEAVCGMRPSLVRRRDGFLGRALEDNFNMNTTTTITTQREHGYMWNKRSNEDGARLGQQRE
jgi:hypothetical protein